ncbi:hypothetical protein ABZ281_13920, partial [Streptomyces sp. NPDC006265]
MPGTLLARRAGTRTAVLAALTLAGATLSGVSAVAAPIADATGTGRTTAVDGQYKLTWLTDQAQRTFPRHRHNPPRSSSRTGVTCAPRSRREPW